MLQIILAAVFYVWLFLVLILLWRHAIGGSAYIRQLQSTLIDATAKSADASKTAAEAAHRSAEAAYILASHISSTGLPPGTL